MSNLDNPIQELQYTVSYNSLPGGRISAHVSKYPECYDTFNNFVEAEQSLRYMVQQVHIELGIEVNVPIMFTFEERYIDTEDVED